MFRRDDARRDASDTYGACNVLTRRRPRTFQSVVVVVIVVVVVVVVVVIVVVVVVIVVF